jgi:hypothetical protein
MAFLKECVAADYDTEIHLRHDIKQIGGMNAYIDIYYWKFYHVKKTDDHYDIDTSRPYYTMYADVRFRNVIACQCQGYERKTVLVQSDIRDGHPTIESMKSLLDEFIDKIQTIQFDKRSGSFTKVNVTIVEECCVCLEPTATRTNCRHHICIPCWDQIKSQRCPICRKDNIYTYCNYE